MRRPWLLVALVTAGACAADPAVRAESLPPCPSRPGGEAWHLVSSERLRFCVPGSWESGGARTWRGEGGSVTWDTGRWEQRAVFTVTRGDRREGPPARAREIHRATEAVDGVPVEMWIQEADGTFFTGAQWTRPRAVYLTGEARSREAAELHLDIYRTVRIVER